MENMMLRSNIFNSGVQRSKFKNSDPRSFEDFFNRLNHTAPQYNKKGVNFAQGLDIFYIDQGKPRKSIENLEIW